LQSQKNAGRFQDRRFPLPVPAHEEIKAGRKFDSERFEATKIPELKFSEHKIQRCRRSLRRGAISAQ
jgi:hypothetical protein